MSWRSQILPSKNPGSGTLLTLLTLATFIVAHNTNERISPPTV